ncbi:hypothetical protein C0989_010166 [Termitomyces sp. Mn162]|nr:hypothetical protein C0989_010166 [Termitomyces sp. Mn162]
MEKYWMGIMSRGLPTPKIRDFVARSGCILQTFHYSDLRGNDLENYQLLRSLLDALPSLRDFSSDDDYTVLFTDDLLIKMKDNILLPKLQTLKIWIESPALFADVIESRVNSELKEEGFIRLKTAFASYWTYKDGVRTVVPQVALEKLEGMNAMYGTNFKMVAH